MQDNYFFREPTTQQRMLEILFIFSKINADIGYRQGMHEVLAPILWVVHSDSLDTKLVTEDLRSKDGGELMLNVLDDRYVAHDTFSIFCGIMQTVKSFYESSSSINHSERIQKELLADVDPDLAHHLQTVGVLPQIYVMPLVRLLFGRQMDFKDVLRLWDSLFAQNLDSELIDMVVVVLLLRARWQLINGDYSSVITTLTRLTTNDAKSVSRDASYLKRNRNSEAGANVVEHSSGRKPKVIVRREESLLGTTPPHSRSQHRRGMSQHGSPAASPARFPTPQRQLENIFNDVSRRTEGWGVQSVSKALRGAVGEVKRNVNSFQTHSRESSVDVRRSFDSTPQPQDTTRELKTRIQALNRRNEALSNMITDALESLRSCRPTNVESGTPGEDTFNLSLAKLQFVAAMLSDADIPLPSEEVQKPRNNAPQASETTQGLKGAESTKSTGSPRISIEDKPQVNSSTKAEDPFKQDEKLKIPQDTDRKNVRPSLTDSSFSFMLGNEKKRSSFVRSVQHRDSDYQSMHESTENKENERRSSKTDDGFDLSTVRGGLARSK